jgi:hypothetical protein
MGGALNDEPRTDGVVCFAGVDWGITTAAIASAS